MKHLSKVYSGDTSSLVTTGVHTYLCHSVEFCNDNSQTGDRCTISESYESLTGREEYNTIMNWVKQRESVQ